MRAEQFEHITKPFILIENKPLKKSAQTLQKSKKIKNAAHSSDGANFRNTRALQKNQ